MPFRPLDFREEQFTRTDDGSVALNIDGTTTKTFRVAAPAGETWYGYELGIYIQAASPWSSNDFASLNALSTGMRVRKKVLSTGVVPWGWNFKRTSAILERFSLDSVVTWTNGNLGMSFKLTCQGDTAFKMTDDEVLEILVRDDLSTIDLMRGHVLFGVL